MSVHAGVLIAGRYRLVARLGGGGMGEVWQARDLSLNVDVAVKTVRNVAEDPERRRAAIAYARKEAQHAAALRDHPNIVAVHDVVEHDGAPVTIMRLVQGRSVAQLLDAAPGGLDEATVERIALGVLDALDAAHRAGIRHRDVKPPNVMVTDAGHVLLTDFGIAKHGADTRITRDGAVVGTVAYIAPERLMGQDLPAGDVWSLGVTLYQAATGISPFERDSAPASIHAITHHQPPRPAAGALTSAIVAMLDKDPSTRAGVAQVRRMLGDEVVAIPRKREWLAPALSVVAVTMAGLLAFAVTNALKDDSDTPESMPSDRGTSTPAATTPVTTAPTVSTSPKSAKATGSPGPDASLCTAAVTISSNALQLSIIGMNDPNNSPVDRMTSAVQPLRTGTTQVNEVAGHATTPAAKAKIQAMANDLTAMADALYAQLPAIRSGQDFNTKAADLAGKQLRTDAGDLGSICWT